MDETRTFERLGGWGGILSRLFVREDLGADGAAAALGEILDGRAQPSQVGAFLAAMRTKGESSEEMIGLSRAMTARAERVVLAPGAIDTCGTGGDRAGTINVSTMAAFVAAGAGVPVCKHGGGASSSLSGSADVLRALGVVIDLGPGEVAECVATAGIGFCFAPRFHPAMRHAAPIRRELGVGTIFNFLGPLCNPGGVTRQVVGVGDATMADKMLGVLEANGSEHVLVVFGDDGLDELTLTGPSTILESRLTAAGTRVRSAVRFDPTEHGIPLVDQAALRGGDAEHNASRVRAVFAGERGPQRDFVLVNAAAALFVSGIVTSIGDGLALAASTIDEGRAEAALQALVETSQSMAPSGS